jgi:L-ascorbate metabolism protein UlaG (beta-lactamase superfamily)
MRKFVNSIIFSVMSATALCAYGQTGKTELLLLGQSAFRITTPGGKVIVIDPWLRLNPATPAQYKDLEKLGKVDLIVVTHGHFDHIADASALAMMNKSGTVTPFADAPQIRITAVKAEHSSVYVWKNPATGKDETHVGGEPIGIII